MQTIRRRLHKGSIGADCVFPPTDVLFEEFQTAGSCVVHFHHNFQHKQQRRSDRLIGASSSNPSKIIHHSSTPKHKEKRSRRWFHMMEEQPSLWSEAHLWETSATVWGQTFWTILVFIIQRERHTSVFCCWKSQKSIKFSSTRWFQESSFIKSQSIYLFFASISVNYM